MAKFIIQDLPLEKLKLITRAHKGDHRGFLSRLFCQDALCAAGWDQPIAQLNHSYTAKKGTVRGFHFQKPPHAEKKLVTCIRGEVWDVVIDLRHRSSTFLQFHCEFLSEDNGRALLIPEGFAHGFQTLRDNTDLIYCHSKPYAPDAEAGLNPLDPTFSVPWPLEISATSSRDACQSMLDKEYEGIRL